VAIWCIYWLAYRGGDGIYRKDVLLICAARASDFQAHRKFVTSAHSLSRFRIIYRERKISLLGISCYAQLPFSIKLQTSRIANTMLDKYMTFGCCLRTVHSWVYFRLQDDRQRLHVAHLTLFLN